MAFHRNTLLLVALLPASIQLACAEMAVPAGFEDLAKTQRLWTEVNLYGESLGLFETDINLETVSFIAPETVVAAIKRQFNDNPSLIATVSAALAVPLRSMYIRKLGDPARELFDRIDSLRETDGK